MWSTIKEIWTKSCSAPTYLKLGLYWKYFLTHYSFNYLYLITTVKPQILILIKIIQSSILRWPFWTNTSHSSCCIFISKMISKPPLSNTRLEQEVRQSFGHSWFSTAQRPMLYVKPITSPSFSPNRFCITFVTRKIIFHCGNDYQRTLLHKYDWQLSSLPGISILIEDSDRQFEG